MPRPDRNGNPFFEKSYFSCKALKKRFYEERLG
jgi:hypothetical protein